MGLQVVTPETPQSLARFCACDQEPILLPPLKKKIIYLDQNAVSNLAHHREPTGKSPDEAWQVLEKRLGRAVRRQLAICPVSLSHQVESAVSPHFEAFMVTAEYFAAGCSFIDFDSIRANQLTSAFVANIERTQFDPFRLPAKDVMDQDPHRWLPIPNPKVLWQMSPGQKTHLRSVRQQGYNGMTVVFQHWKSMPGRRIEEWKEVELRSGRLADGELLLKNLPNLGLLDRYSPQALCEAAVEFVQSPAYADVPFVSVYSWLYATAARKAKDKREPPDRGFLRDTETIACLLPYCDAVFVDNMCRAYLNELRSAGRLVFDTRIFSKTNIDDLFNFVDQLENDLAPEVARLVEEIYRGN